MSHASKRNINALNANVSKTIKHFKFVAMLCIGLRNVSYIQCKVVDGEPMTLSKQGELEQYLIPPPPAAATTVPLLGLKVSKIIPTCYMMY